MCGISAYFARETPPTKEALECLFRSNEVRGTDAVGIALLGYGKGKFIEVIDEFKHVGMFPADELASKYVDVFRRNDIVICNHRAAPETESESYNDLTIQPIIDVENGLYLVHNGAVSNFIYTDLNKKYKKVSDIDSEAIIWAYLEHNRHMYQTMQYLSGGFAFIMVDALKEKLYIVCSHNPLYCGYVRGHGLFFSSMEEGIYDTISAIKGTKISRNNVVVWEDYYCRNMPPYTITEIDIPSGMINELPFTPRYIHPKYDPYKVPKTKNMKVLVSASGGLDSTTTLAVLKEAGYDITAVHFKYGHRGQDCEEYAIRHITDSLNVPLVVFDIQENMKILDNDSMLVDSQHEITTGTEGGLKSTVAWTCFRNGLFLTYMGALAEKEIINNHFSTVYITGGYCNLTESGVYGDNSERFVDSFSKFCNFASIVGTKIKPFYACSNLLKTDQYVLLDKLGYLDKLSPLLISCDRPKMIDGIPHNCSKNGLPACGSGLLSYWATKLAGVTDNRRYYEIEGEYTPFVPNSKLEPKTSDVKEVLKKLQIHTLNMRILQRKLL